MHISPSRILSAAALLLAAVAPLKAQGAPGERVAQAWEFNTPEQVTAWRPVRTTPPQLQEGALKITTEGRDPQILAPSFTMRTSAHQTLVIRMRSSVAGPTTVYWSNTTEGRWGGFDNAKSLTFRVPGDGQFHEYRLAPFWHVEKQLILFRIDPPDSAEVAFDYVRVVEAPATASRATSWDSPDGWRKVPHGDDTLLLSPPLDVPADPWAWVTCQVTARDKGIGRLYWVTDTANGLQSAAFPVRAGTRVQNVELPTASAWRGRILALGLILPEGARAGRVALAADPQGAAEPEVASLGLRDAINRAGRPAVLVAGIRNLGGTAARNLRARVQLPAGMTLAPGENAEKSLDPVDYNEIVEVSWNVRAAKPGSYPVALQVTGPDVPALSGKAQAEFTPTIPVAENYVPVPKPVATDYEVGVYYYPGWHAYPRWARLNGFPERRPVLGYYREGSPEVADWHIKWAVEHGIKFFIYDWYWTQGRRHNEKALHEGFFNARYREMMKFCLLWANHNPPNTSSEQDLLNVTDYWIANYFKRPEYYKINGCPVMVIFSPGRLTEDMGVEGVKQAFLKVRAKMKAAGFPDIYLIACTRPAPATLRVLKEEGYDCASAYNYPDAGAPGQLHAPYSLAVTGHEEIWNEFPKLGTMDYIPATTPGWDSRPWHGDTGRIRTGKTPELFRDMLMRSRRFVDKHTPAGRPRVVFIEAWNEFGEGDFIEPHREWGFAHVDAVRSVFAKTQTPHQDVIPADVGRGPYDMVPEPLRTAWEFNADGKFEGWDGKQNMTETAVRGGALCGTAATRDPAFIGHGLTIPARKFRVIEIRMKLDRGGEAQLYWSRANAAFNEECTLRFPVTTDNEYHVYRLEVGKSAQWRGNITQLRLDPSNVPGLSCAVDYIRLLPE